MEQFNNLKSRNEFSDFLNIPRKQLSYLLYIKKINNSYTTFEIQKKSGGVRKISAPSDELKAVQKKLVEALYKHRKSGNGNKFSHAFEKQKSIITNARIHRKKRFVLNIDLENFFESIHFGRVRGFFNKNKNFLLPIEVATIVAQLSCYEGKLPQGAPSSPIISNLICEILDYRLFKIAKKYKLNYTRYADDLTFSTNDNNFVNNQDDFYNILYTELEKSGFKINEKKKRLQLNSSRQEVTGLVVNEKLNVNRVYYKETRAMAHQLYKQGEFTVNGNKATLLQLEGRFSFINQLTWYNNKIDDRKHNFHNLSSRELQYQKFLFYKYFFANPKPLIVTEGKTDVVYLKSALKSLYKEYPNLITKNKDGAFQLKVSFLNKTKRLQYFMGIFRDGGSALNNIYNFYDHKKSLPDYLKYFQNISNTSPSNPVFLLFDNEIKSKSKKPIGQFLNHISLTEKRKSLLEIDYIVKLIGNLYLLTVPLVKGKEECDVEDLFDNTVLSHTISGRIFTKEDNYDVSKYYGKDIFSKYILKNYNNINFNDFKPILDNISQVVDSYSKETVTNGVLEISHKDKVPLEV
ncbi:retron Ec67 family RNA-directed DNA polymerase/endonuclease [Paenibacillus sp. PDC88]|uniref:retron Ec67 family RNA-directed DNA polymerase/endonuclease n=1 Tax=Paenibacillus TaxID=44249 RepID=UPI00089634A2|nr:retron Ec67 family RNA-directed DNA polymerase/endonuclease [Paenibacillus sp. PDC88]SDW93036.1 RNA-directed DNA polymerase [Paenibacillus sp. PDC88]